MKILSLIRWQDVLDILIVTVIIYRILLIIKGTRAAQMLIGIGVLFAALLFSRYLELYTIDWIIQSLWAQIVLALIILFQPEIRKTLAQMGEARFLPSFTSVEELRYLEEIVKGTVALANRKIGAAIVIRGNRVVAAGCFLPLTLSMDISKAFGTRHRAGLGLTEETDAVVIIVSEETGSITTAVGDNLEKNIDIGELRDFLTENFIKLKEKKK
jgi:diadenylate cyclase